MNPTNNQYRYSERYTIKSGMTFDTICNMITDSLEEYFIHSELEELGPSLRYDSVQWRLARANIGRPPGMPPMIPSTAKALP